jgi:amino acid transporter
MAFSMVINQSLVARTFGTYTLQLFDVDQMGYLVPLLGVGLLTLAFIVNISRNRFIQTFTSIASLLKIIGLSIFAIGGLWIAGFTFESAPGGGNPPDPSIATNSGSEIVKPKKNVGRAITISISISVIVYLLIAWAVSSIYGCYSLLGYGYNYSLGSV